MPRITPHLWYTKEAEEAARFYVSILPNSRVDRVVKFDIAELRRTYEEAAA